MSALLDLALVWDLGMILIAATLMSYIMRLLKQPPLLAYIVAGLILGPIGLGALGVEISGVPIGISSMEDILILSELGVAFLLFSVGVETEFNKLFQLGKTLVIGAVLQVVITALVVIGASIFMSSLGFEQAVYLGVILAFSSTMVVIKNLSDKKHINTLHGRIMIGFLLVQDFLVILAIPLLADFSQLGALELLVPVILQAGALILLAFVLSRWVYPWVFNFAVQSDELLYLAGLSSCFVFIGVAYLMDFSIAIGAFIAGLALSTLPYNLEVYHKVRGIRDFFATIFFVTLGMQITFDFVSFPVALILLLLAVVYIVKPLLFFLITLFSGYGARLSFLIAIGLAQVSEFSFVLANQGYNAGKGILAQTPGLYSVILIVIALSMVTTSYFGNYSTQMFNFLEKLTRQLRKMFSFVKFKGKKMDELEQPASNLQDHLVIIGCGTMGTGVATALKDIIHLIVIDHDSERVLWARSKGINAIYGSIDNEEVLDRANLGEAKLVVMAIPDVNAELDLIKHVRKHTPHKKIFGRAHYFNEALALYNKGVDYVIMPHVVSTNLFIEDVAKYLDTGKVEHISNLNTEFLDYIKEAAEEEKKTFQFDPLQ